MPCWLFVSCCDNIAISVRELSRRLLDTVTTLTLILELSHQSLYPTILRLSYDHSLTVPLHLRILEIESRKLWSDFGMLWLKIWPDIKKMDTFHDIFDQKAAKSIEISITTLRNVASHCIAPCLSRIILSSCFYVA